MLFICGGCGFEDLIPVGLAANHFAYLDHIECPSCGEVTVFPKLECLTFTLMAWRN